MHCEQRDPATYAVSGRESEVLEALAEHLSNAEIAARLFISVRTVESHVSSLLRKLQAGDRRALAALARQRAAHDAVAGVESGVPVLPGQDTLLACWRALARLSPGARVVRSPLVHAALFPAWAPLNNAIVAAHVDDDMLDHAVAPARSLYADAGVAEWALWIPSRVDHFGGPDSVRLDGCLERDTTTLVMHATLTGRPLRRDTGVVATSIASVVGIDGEPVPASALEPPDAVPNLSGWALVREGMAVCCAWSYLHGTDCGIFGVETVPDWRRRGAARALLEHVLCDARSRGAHTSSLQSTRMGQPLYESLGFRAAGRYEEWLHR